MTAQDAEARRPDRYREARIRRALRLLEILMALVALVVVTLWITGRMVPNGTYLFAAALGLATGLLVRSQRTRPRHDNDRP